MPALTIAHPGRTPGRKATPVARPKITTHLVLTSPTQARAMAADFFERQRPLDEGHVEELRWLFAHGYMRAGTTVTFAVYQQQRYLINGRHTLTAFGRTTGQPFWFQVEEYRVDRYADIGYLYQTYDRHRRRTWSDLYRADPDLATLEVRPTAIRDLGAAAMWFIFGFARNHPVEIASQLTTLAKASRVRLTLMADWHDELANALNGCKGPPAVTKLLRRAAVWAVILVTYRGPTVDVAHQFWPRLARDSGLVEGDPAHTLLRWLRATPARSMQPDAYSRAIAAAWNAAYHGRELYVLRARTTDQPLLLLGTPHDGTAHRHYVTPEGTVLHTPEPWPAVVSGVSVDTASTA